MYKLMHDTSRVSCILRPKDKLKTTCLAPWLWTCRSARSYLRLCPLLPWKVSLWGRQNGRFCSPSWRVRDKWLSGRLSSSPQSPPCACPCTPSMMAAPSACNPPPRSAPEGGRGTQAGSYLRKYPCRASNRSPDIYSDMSPAFRIGAAQSTSRQPLFHCRRFPATRPRRGSREWNQNGRLRWRRRRHGNWKTSPVPWPSRDPWWRGTLTLWQWRCGSRRSCVRWRWRRRWSAGPLVSRRDLAPAASGQTASRR